MSKCAAHCNSKWILRNFNKKKKKFYVTWNENIWEGIVSKRTAARLRNKRVTNLPSSENYGGQLGTVPPLGEEGEGEGLDENGRDDAGPFSRRHGASRSGLHIWSSVNELWPLELRTITTTTNWNIILDLITSFTSSQYLIFLLFKSTVIVSMCLNKLPSSHCV